MPYSVPDVSLRLFGIVSDFSTNVVHVLKLIVLLSATRETAFVFAMTVAGIIYSVSRECALGDLRECGCDRSWIKKTHQYGDWFWGGCGDNIEYGVEFSRNFILARTPDKDLARENMDKHNVIAGGKVYIHTHLLRECGNDIMAEYGGFLD